MLFLSGGDDDDSFSPVLYLLVGQLDLFASEVLERLGPTARASLTRAGSAFRGVFPFGFPRAETMNGGGGAARVLKLKEFVGRRAAGVGQGAACPWDGGRVTPPLRAGSYLDELQCAGARLPVGQVSCHAAPSVQGTCPVAVLRLAREHDCPYDARI